MSWLSDPRYRTALGTGLVVLVLDQVTKAIVEQSMALHQSIPVLPFLAITYARNTGAAFSLLAHAPSLFRVTLLVSVSVFAIVLVLRFVARTPATDRPTLLGLGAVLGGAVGNLIDRAWLGEVRDFVELHYREWSWPVFNVADAAICVGVGLLLLTQSGQDPHAARPADR